ncbi:MAG TPA: YlxR family protein [Firmicutes bacterium]|nr:YlxR family protein [Bacillota bacterium]
MKRKHIPIRTCVGCRQTKPKKELIRVVRTPQAQIEIDLTGKKSGRGAYLCQSKECLSKALQRRQLQRALETDISEEIKVLLEQQLDG